MTRLVVAPVATGTVVGAPPNDDGCDGEIRAGPGDATTPGKEDVDCEAPEYHGRHDARAKRGTVLRGYRIPHHRSGRRAHGAVGTVNLATRQEARGADTMNTMFRGMVATAAVLALLLTATGGALAGHESNNRFDLAPTADGPAGADGDGVSNYVKGKSKRGQEVWNSAVDVTGLAPNTAYSFWAENANGVIDGQDTLVCAFTTDAVGAGDCSATFHPEPAFARATIRVGEPGAVVLLASGSTDEDNMVDDGEIERRGDCRSPDQAGGTCTGGHAG